MHRARAERKKENTHAKRGMGRGQGPHLHEQDFGRTISGTVMAVHRAILLAFVLCEGAAWRRQAADDRVARSNLSDSNLTGRQLHDSIVSSLGHHDSSLSTRRWHHEAQLRARPLRHTAASAQTPPFLFCGCPLYDCHHGRLHSGLALYAGCPGGRGASGVGLRPRRGEGREALLRGRPLQVAGAPPRPDLHDRLVGRAGRPPLRWSRA